MTAFLKSSLLLLICMFIAAPRPADAQPEEKAGQEDRTVRVYGEATAQAAPDMATVRFAVVTRNKEPEAAREANAEAARAAMDAVRTLIEDEKQMRMESLRLQPDREYDPEKNRYIERGYEAVRDVVVTVENLDTLPALVTRIVQEGANRLHGVSYELKHQDAVRNEALKKAVRNAREKAKLMAETLDAAIGDVLRISEQDTGGPRPLMRSERMETMAAARSAEPEPASYAPGEIEVQVKVDVTFALEN